MTIDPVTGGGTAERTLQMSRHLAKAGADCTILTTDIGITQALSRMPLENVKIVVLPLLCRRFHIPRIGLGTIGTCVAEADIVHMMNHWTVLNALVYRAVQRHNKPYVVCPAGALSVYGRSRMIKKIYRAAIGNRIIRRADGHIAITNEEIKQFSDYGVSPDQVSVIPNGINKEENGDVDQVSFRETVHLDGSPFILFVGRLNTIKGPDLLLRAFCNIHNRFRDVHLVFLGPDEGLLPDLKNMVSVCGMEERVHFPGYLGGKEKWQAYQQASLLVVPSRLEAMSIVALEAGINGTPVLLTNQCGFDEVAHVGGGLVVPASVAGIQEGLEALLNDSLRLKEMGKKLKDYVSRNYLWEKIVHQYLALYGHILSERT